VITDVDRSAGTATPPPRRLSFMEQDVCDEQRWTQVVGEIEQRLGRLNILVNTPESSAR